MTIMNVDNDVPPFDLSTADDDGTFLDSLPPAISAAVKAQDIQALDLALRQMPRREAEAMTAWLVKAGILVQRSEADLEREQWAAYYPPNVVSALDSGNIDAVYAALAELPPEEADRLYELLQQQGLL